MSRRTRDRYDDERPRDRKKRKTGLILALVLGGAGLLVLIVGGACAGGIYFATRKPARTYSTVSLDRLADEWKTNSAAAAAKYQSEGVEFSGTLLEVSSNLSHQTYIEVGAAAKPDSDRDAHVFVLSSDALDGLKKVKVGDRIVVRARSSTGNLNPRPWLIADEIRPVK